MIHTTSNFTKPSPREFAAQKHGFAGRRGRLPKPILAEYAELYGEWVKPEPVAKTPKARRVVASPNNGWQAGGLADRPEDEVLSLLTNKKVTWKNEISGQVMAAIVRKPVITTANSGRKIVTFNTDEGFRSVALENL